ncbi:TPA: hypothetical protein ACQUH4_001942, partial [Neisseria cinerea]
LLACNLKKVQANIFYLYNSIVYFNFGRFITCSCFASSLCFLFLFFSVYAYNCNGFATQFATALQRLGDKNNGIYPQKI